MEELATKQLAIATPFSKHTHIAQMRAAVFGYTTTCQASSANGDTHCVVFQKSSLHTGQYMTGKQTSPSVTTLTQHPGTTLVGMLRMSLAVNVGVSTLTVGVLICVIRQMSLHNIHTLQYCWRTMLCTRAILNSEVRSWNHDWV